jgi:hypothetical protein
VSGRNLPFNTALQLGIVALLVTPVVVGHGMPVAKRPGSTTEPAAVANHQLRPDTHTYSGPTSSRISSATRPLDLKKLSMADFGDVEDRR